MNHRSPASFSSPVRRVTTSLIVLGVLASCTSGDGDGDELGVPGVDDTTTIASTMPTAPTTATNPVPTTPAPTTPAAVDTTTPPAETAPAETAAPSTAPAVEPSTTIAAPETSSAPAGTFLRSGDEGPEVAIVQLKLQTAGFLEPGYTEGVFDAATNAAVIAFQGQYGLLVDGVVGPETDRALTAAALSVNPEGE